MKLTGLKLLLLCNMVLLSFATVKAVELRDSTYTYRCYKYEVNDGGWFVSGPTNEIVTTNYPVKVIENEFLRLLLLPDYGGRVISCFNKLTQKEELYQANPATPYCGPGGRTFYYNYLVVPGGIYPTFPEPEHGKAWNQKWNLTVVKNNPEEVTVEMSYLDDKYNYVSEKWKHGITHIQCAVGITLSAGKSSFDYSVRLENTRPNEQGYEYWTCVTFTPGSEPGNTYSPLNTEMIVPLEKAQYKSNWWGWMGSADEGRNTEPNVPWLGGSIHAFMNLKWFEKWENEGIAYGYPYVVADYWGAINHDKEEGMLRIADNTQFTPGLKIWTWGKNSINANMSDPNDYRRAHMEMWAGNSREFFIADKMGASEIKQWKETYYPIIGLERVDTASETCALSLDYEATDSVDVSAAWFVAKVSSIYPEADHVLNFRAIDNVGKEYMLFDGTKKFTGAEALQLRIDQRNKQVPKGEYTLLLEVKNGQGNTLIQYSKPVQVTFDLDPIRNTFSTDHYTLKDVVGFKKEGNYLFVEKKSKQPVVVVLYDLMGKKLIGRRNIQKNSAIRLPAQKCYILKVDNMHKTYQTLITPER